MATAHLIDPFPLSIDHEAFGHWLSGFTDGEGCFFLRLQPVTPRRHQPLPDARFSILLRADDLPVLHLIQSFLGCGYIIFHDRSRLRAVGSKGQDSFSLVVNGIDDLHSVIAPHFHRYPLRAKKARDFAIWSAAVDFIHQVTRDTPHYKRHRHGMRWTESRMETFRGFVNDLHATRSFTAPAFIPPPKPTPPPEPSLFD